MSDVDALRARLQQALDARGQSAFWLSGEAHVGANTVGNFLKGSSHNMRPESWERVAAVLGWDVGLTLAEAGYAPPPPPPADVAGQMDRLLQQAGVPDAARESLMQHIRLVLGQLDGPTAGPGPPVLRGFPTTRRRN